MTRRYRRHSEPGSRLLGFWVRTVDDLQEGRASVSVQRIVIEAAEHDIFSVLLDPYTYPEWLVGAQRIRSVDDAWPEPGTAFHHVVGFGPIKVADSTRVERVSS